MARLIGVSFCVLICSILLRESNKAFSSILSIAGGLLAFFTVSSKLAEVSSSLKSITQSVPAGAQYISIMLRVMCIIILARLVCDACRDNGEGALASFTEISAKILVLSIVFPLFEAIINVVIGLIK